MGKDLAGKINTDPLCRIQPASKDFFVILDVDNEEIEKNILNLRNNCAVGWDGVSSTVLKSTRHVLIPLFAHICNLSISFGIFPCILLRLKGLWYIQFKSPVTMMSSITRFSFVVRSPISGTLIRS